MKRALVSVTNKDGIVDFCKGLVDLGFEIVSTGERWLNYKQKMYHVLQLMM